MLSNNGLCLHAAVNTYYYFLILAVNSDWYNFTEFHSLTEATDILDTLNGKSGLLWFVL